MKTWLFLLILLPIISGVYGILHNQVTYSISSEYFVYFKFDQFNFSDGLRDNERLGAALVGLLSTWWVGLILAIPLGIIGFRKMDAEQYRKSRIQSIKIIFLIAILFGGIGYCSGLITVSNMADQPMQVGTIANFHVILNFSKIQDWDSFMIAGSIHNFSYLGALIGLVIALLKQFRITKRLRQT